MTAPGEICVGLCTKQKVALIIGALASVGVLMAVIEAVAAVMS